MFRFCSALLLSAILLCTSYSASAVSPSADQIFPDSTKGFFSIRNLKDFGEQWKQTQFGQFMDDPLIAEFKKGVQKQLTERMETTFGLTLDGISSLPSGEVAVGMIAVPNQIPGYVLTMDVTGKRTETDEYLIKLTQKLVSAGAKKSTETYKGQQITVLTFPPAEVQTPRTLGKTKIEIKVEPIERKAYYMFRQDVLIASDQLHLLRLIADRIADQSGKSLAAVEAYQVVMKRCLGEIPGGTPPTMRWYVEPLDYGESVRISLRGPTAQRQREKPSIFSILKQQGFDAVQGIGGTVSVKTEAHEAVYRTFVVAKKPYRLAMRMLDLPARTDFTPPAWMPADLARCTMFNVEPMTILDNFGGLFDALVTPGEEGVWKDIVEGLEKDPYGPRINIRNELVAHLGTRVFSMSRYEKPITVKSESIVVAVELKAGRESAMQASAKKLFGNDPEMRGTVHNSYTIWHRIPEEVPVPVKPVAADDRDAPPFFPDGGVVVAKGHLFVSSNANYLKTILDRLDAANASAQTTIGTVAEYKEVNQILAGMGLAGKPHYFQFFARTYELVRPTYEMIRQDQMSHSQTLLGKLLNELFSPEEESGVRRQLFDGSTLPEFEKVQHYFGKVGIYGVAEENGYFIKGFMVEREH